MKPIIYLDHSATTPTDARVVEAMLPYWTECYGNPSSAHQLGKVAAQAIDNARQKIASVLNCLPDEILFTSGGTESNNLALRGVAYGMKARGRGKHIITTAVEHHAVLDVVQALAVEGFDITVLPVDPWGRVNPDHISTALRDDTILVSVMYANNEVGTINPIAAIGALLKGHRAKFHVDAVQAPGLLPLDVQALGVDLLSLSGHKFYGPKGCGVLYINRLTPLQPQIVGGGQQAGRRGGTEAVPLIVGLAEALIIADQERIHIRHLQNLRDNLIAQIQHTIPQALLTGHPQERLAGHASFALESVNGDAVLLDLNEMGIAASGGSACTTGQQEPSHVLKAMAIDESRLMGQLRFVLGRFSTQQDIDALLYHLKAIVKRHA